MVKKSRRFERDFDDGSQDMFMSDEEFEALLERSERRAPRVEEKDTEIEALEPGARVTGLVIANRGGEILLEIGSKAHGVIPEEEFGDDPLPEVGTELSATFVRYDRAQDLAVLSVHEVRREVFWDELRVGMLLEGTVTGVNKGGLTLEIKKTRAFMPISQIERGRVEDPSVYIGKRLRCEVVSFDRGTENLVVSRRAILEREAEAARAQAIENLIEGEVMEGTVTKLTHFGAFVDVGGVEGLLHKNKILEHQKELGKEEPLEVGQKIEVEIVRVDPERGRVTLDFRRRTLPTASRAPDGYAPGDEVTGWVRAITAEGAVLSFGDGVDGLIPAEFLTESIQEGSIVNAVIVRLDSETGKVELKPI